MRYLIKIDAFVGIYLMISIVISIVSFLPILNEILALESWRGYGWNAYIYTNWVYEITYSDIFHGDKKPMIRLYPPYYFAKPVDLVEFNGYESYICGYNMIKDMINMSIKTYNRNILKVVYTYRDMDLVQEIIVLNNSVLVKYSTSRVCNFQFVILRWYYESVANITFVDMGNYNMKFLGVTSAITFTLKDEDRSTSGIGIIEINKPIEAIIEKDSKGINKIWILISNISEVIFTVKGDLKEYSRSLSISNIFSYRSIRYILLATSLLLIVVLYRPLRKQWEKLNNKTKLLLATLIIRLVLAPFFMHLWDVNTIQVSVYQVMNRVNPYEYVYNMTQRLRSIAGLPINYEGFAYLPHALFIFFPFYFLYLAFGTEPLPLRGVRDPLHVITFYLHPDIYLFLFIIKLPIIIVDVLVASILYNHFNENAAKLYAFSPYVIFITSIWGMFDNIIALALLLTIVLLKKNRFVSAGFMYGISLIKFYTIYIVLPLLYNVWKNNGLKSLAKFVAGIIISQIPTFHFLYKNPIAFIFSTLIFHGLRPGGGINILNVLWNIKDLHFNIEVSNIATAISIVATLFVSIYTIMRRMNLEKAMISISVIGILLGKITNEQYLLPIYTLLLSSTQQPYIHEFTRKLSLGYLIFALLNTRGVYLCFPILALIGRTFEYNIRELIRQLFSNESYYYISNTVLFILGVKLFAIEVLLLLFILLPYNNSSTLPRFLNNENSISIDKEENC
ncbi:MAG: hypothetical protein QXY40_10865 [Candidatus Methanomethylicia archaeon]